MVPLTADLSAFDDNGKHMIALLVQAAEVMDDLYWQQSWRRPAPRCWRKAPDAATRALVELNFGPWDRLNEDTPLRRRHRPASAGRAFYPADMTKDEFEQADAARTRPRWYTLLRRDAPAS